MSALILGLGLSDVVALSAKAQVNLSDVGFRSKTVVRLPPFTVVGFTSAAGGRISVSQKKGVVRRIFENGTLLPLPLIDISAKVNPVQDRGLLGLVLDSIFSTKGYVYLAFIYKNTGNPNDPGPRTSRLTAEPANPDVVIAGSEVVILGGIGTPPCTNYPGGSDFIPADEVTHTLGTIQDSLRRDQP